MNTNPFTSLSSSSMTSGVVLAADAMIFLLAFLGGTYITWWAIGIVKWDKFVQDPYGSQARMLRFLVAMFGGFTTGLIALFYLFAGQALRMLF